MMKTLIGIIMNTEHNFIINPDDKFYPQANEWMWDYCTFLGKFTDSQGNNYDLGVYIRHSVYNGEIFTTESEATVYGNEPGDYYSGDFRHIRLDDNYKWIGQERLDEAYRRAKVLNLIK